MPRDKMSRQEAEPPRRSGAVRGRRARSSPREEEPVALPKIGKKGRAPRYGLVRYPDDTLRPVRYSTKSAGLRRQAEADLYGDVAPLSTGANMRDMASILTEVVSRLSLTQAEFAPEFLEQAWRNAVGDCIASQSQLLSLTNGCAHIRARHPMVCFELRRQRAQLIRSLNEAFGEGCVRSVKIGQ